MSTTEFTYIFGEKDGVLLVLFQGEMTGKEVPILEKCEAELKEKESKAVLFVFRDVPRFIPGAYPIFVRIQKNLRDGAKAIGSCSLRPEIRESLRINGIVRDPEVYNNIPDAWKDLKSKI